MNLILFSVTTFAVLDYFYRFMRFVSTDLAKIAKFLCFYSKSGLKMFAEKGMTAKDIISHRLPLDEVPNVFAEIAKGGYFYNKIMFYPWGEN